MRVFLCFALMCLAAGISARGQSAPGSELPKNPREVLSLAAPFYNFSDPSLKPWHLKATYQLYDEAGKQTSQGTYEYWWVSPIVSRSTWVRGENTHTDWHTGDGKYSYLSTGSGLEFFEYRLQSDILTPLPAPAEYDSATTYFNAATVNLGNVKAPCIMIVPKMPQVAKLMKIPLGMFPTYCFDPRLPVLITKTSFGSLTVSYGHVARIQDRYMPKVIDEYEAGHKILTMTVDTLEDLSPDDPALIPPPAAKITSVKPVAVATGLMEGRRVGGPCGGYGCLGRTHWTRRQNP